MSCSGRRVQEERHPGPRPAERGRSAQTGDPMSRERRFGKHKNEPSTVQIVHELKLMALRQSLDAAVAREPGQTVPAAMAFGNLSSSEIASSGAPRPDAF